MKNIKKSNYIGDRAKTDLIIDGINFYTDTRDIDYFLIAMKFPRDNFSLPVEMEKEIATVVGRRKDIIEEEDNKPLLKRNYNRYL